MGTLTIVLLVVAAGTLGACLMYRNGNSPLRADAGARHPRQRSITATGGFTIVRPDGKRMDVNVPLVLPIPACRVVA